MQRHYEHLPSEVAGAALFLGLWMPTVGEILDDELRFHFE